MYIGTGCATGRMRNWKLFFATFPKFSGKAHCVMMYSFGRTVFPSDTHVGRVLARIGPYRELGLSLEGLDHKQLQRELAELIPPNLRYSLHVNLVKHGRAVCRSAKATLRDMRIAQTLPSLPISGMCASLRDDRAHGDRPICGAGGSSEGFARAGFKILAAVEADEMAARTYRLNHPAVPDVRVIVQDIRTVSVDALRQLSGKKHLDVLAGSPPCQGFSSVGLRSKKTLLGYRPGDDDRNLLYETMVETALVLKPKLFLMENVPGMNRRRNKIIRSSTPRPSS